MRYFTSLITIVLIAFCPVAQAQTVAGELAGPDEQTVERTPEEGVGAVDIREYQEGAQAITEYRRFGQLYMLKVKPKGTAPLYMMDQYGDGELNRRPADSIEDDVNLPKWRLGNF